MDDSTRWASESNPFRMSVASAPRKIRTVGGQLSMGDPPARPGPDRGWGGRTRKGPGRSGRSAARSRSGARAGARSPPGRPPAPAGRPEPLRSAHPPAHPGSRRGLPVAAGQLLPPPPEGPVLQPLAKAEVADGEPAPLLLSDRPPPELLPGGVTSFATAFRHDGVPSALTDRSEGIVPWPSRWGSYDGYGITGPEAAVLGTSDGSGTGRRKGQTPYGLPGLSCWILASCKFLKLTPGEFAAKTVRAAGYGMR